MDAGIGVVIFMARGACRDEAAPPLAGMSVRVSIAHTLVSVGTYHSPLVSSTQTARARLPHRDVGAVPIMAAALIIERQRLLFRHGDQEPVFWRDQVVVIVGRDPSVELDPLHLAGEWSPGVSVISGHRRPTVMTNVAGLLAECERLRSLDASFAGFRSVYEQRQRAALGNAAAVVLELQPNLVVAGGQRAAAFDVSLLQAEEVVADLRFAALHVDAQATGHAAQGDDDPFGATGGH